MNDVMNKVLEKAILNMNSTIAVDKCLCDFHSNNNNVTVIISTNSKRNVSA